MSIDSIYSAASTTHIAHHAGNKPAAGQSAQTGTPTANLIEDTISLSAEAKQGVAVDQSATVKGAVRVSDEQSQEFSKIGDMFIAHMEAGRQYGEEQMQFDMKKRDEIKAIMGKLNRESGGLLAGTAYSDDLSKPITTTSGSPHPYADEIRAFLQNHTEELNQLKVLSQEKFPSFQDWMKSQD